MGRSSNGGSDSTLLAAPTPFFRLSDASGRRVGRRGRRTPQRPAPRSRAQVWLPLASSQACLRPHSRLKHAMPWPASALEGLQPPVTCPPSQVPRPHPRRPSVVATSPSAFRSVRSTSAASYKSSRTRRGRDVRTPTPSHTEESCTRTCCDSISLIPELTYSVPMPYSRSGGAALWVPQSKPGSCRRSPAT